MVNNYIFNININYMFRRALMCALGLHEYEVFKEEAITNVKDEVIGKMIVNRCKHCGRLKSKRIILIAINNL